MVIRFLKNKLSIVLISALVVTGCSAGNGENLDAFGAPITDANETDTPVDVDQTPDAPPVVVSAFRDIQDTIFTPVCAECHSAAFASAGLRLDDGASFAALVEVLSTEVPTLARIQPGDPDNSYLVQKIEGTQAVGGQMPLGGPPLAQAEMDLVRQWVTDGALPETTATAALAARVVSASIDDNASLRGLPATVSIVWSSEVVQSSFDSATVSLVGSGGDNSFNDGNEVPLVVSMTDSRNGFVTQFSANGVVAEDDVYQLRISGSGDVYAIALDATPIDGDGDGIPGGNFIYDFSIDSE